MVIAYLRVGTSNKELLEEQKDEIERYASNHDMNVDKWITDVTVDKGREDERNLARALRFLLLLQHGEHHRTLSQLLLAGTRRFPGEGPT